MTKKVWRAMNMKKKFFTIMLAAAMAVNFGVLPTMAESN